MKMCFKFQKNRTMNEEIDFSGVKGKAGGVHRFLKFRKVPYKIVVQTQTKNFSTLAQLENI